MFKKPVVEAVRNNIREMVLNVDLRERG